MPPIGNALKIACAHGRRVSHPHASSYTTANPPWGSSAPPVPVPAPPHSEACTQITVSHEVSSSRLSLCSPITHSILLEDMPFIDESTWTQAATSNHKRAMTPAKEAHARPQQCRGQFRQGGKEVAHSRCLQSAVRSRLPVHMEGG